jgi:HEAT repeat protein
MIQQLTTTELIGKTLTQKLNDPDRQVRAKAAETLGKLGNPLWANAILQQFHTETDQATQLIQILALGNLQNPDVIPDLAVFVGHQNPEIRSATVSALSQIGTPVVIDYLRHALNDQEANIRAIAATGLGEIGSEEVIPALAAACSDRDDTVRLNAVEALGKIGDRYSHR